MKIHVEKKLTQDEKIDQLKATLQTKEEEISHLKNRLEATEEALITLMFGGKA